jgi:phosphate transport system permease protein
MAVSALGGAQAPPSRLGRVRRMLSVPGRRTELVLGAVACLVLAIVGGMVIFVFSKAWPSFANNGLAWFSAGGRVDDLLLHIFKSPADPAHYVYTFHAWPLLYATALITGLAVSFGLVFALLCAVFIVEFAPDRIQRVLEPAVRLLAAVPSVIYGLIGILVLVPFVSGSLITEGERDSVSYVIPLTGNSLIVAVVILTVMIVPIMIAIIVDALRAVPRNWIEGGAALGVNRWRVMWTISVRTARPAIVAATILATARALGEAIMISMVSGSLSFAPNPLDGITFLFEPTRTLAATVVENQEGLSVIPFSQTIYAIAAILLISSMALSWGGWLAKQPMKKYGVRP